MGTGWWRWQRRLRKTAFRPWSSVWRRCRDGAGEALPVPVCTRPRPTVLPAGRRYLCLFYDNPAAGRIYHALGFADVGRFGMAMPE